MSIRGAILKAAKTAQSVARNTHAPAALQQDRKTSHAAIALCKLSVNCPHLWLCNHRRAQTDTAYSRPYSNTANTSCRYPVHLPDRGSTLLHGQFRACRLAGVHQTVNLRTERGHVEPEPEDMLAVLLVLQPARQPTRRVFVLKRLPHVGEYPAFQQLSGIRTERGSGLEVESVSHAGTLTYDRSPNRAMASRRRSTSSAAALDSNPSSASFGRGNRVRMRATMSVT